MSLSWPWALLALLILPLLLAAWWLARRMRRRATVRVTSIALVAAALPGRSRWRRRLPVALLAAGLAVLAVGAARPQATVPQASSSATIMLALDVSGSMCSTDVKPNRIDAAEQSAGAFIKSQAGGPRIGIVLFSGSAVVLVPPTTNTQQLLSGLGGITVGGATVKRNLGAGYADDVIVVLTDGSNNRGVDPQVAAREAAARGVRVFTIGYGTDNPAQLECDATQFGGYSGGLGGGGFTGGGGGGTSTAGNPFDADYSALQQISKASGGTFFRAQDASQLSSALDKLPAAFTIVHKHVDIAAAFAALGGLLIAAAVALSLWWNRIRRPAPRPEVTSS